MARSNVRTTSTPKNAGGVTAPERVADDSSSRASTVIIGGVQQATCFRLHAKNFEEAAADPQYVGHADLASTREIDLLRTPGEDSGKALLLGAHLLPLRSDEHTA